MPLNTRTPALVVEPASTIPPSTRTRSDAVASAAVAIDRIALQNIFDIPCLLETVLDDQDSRRERRRHPGQHNCQLLSLLGQFYPLMFGIGKKKGTLRF